MDYDYLVGEEVPKTVPRWRRWLWRRMTWRVVVELFVIIIALYLLTLPLLFGIRDVMRQEYDQCVQKLAQTYQNGTPDLLDKCCNFEGTVTAC